MKKLLALILCLGLMTGCSSSGVETVNGDVVKIDYVGKLNGTAFSGGAAQDALLELGSHTFIDGFEEQLVGMNVGKEKSIKVTFPSNYSSTDLAGKETTFDVTLHQTYREEKDLTSEKGDIVKIDYVGKLDGTAFEGGTANGALLELGSGTFIPGFEEQLIGMKSGDQKTITVTFPSSYSASDLAGKETTFDVAVNHIYREVKK